MFNLLKNTNMLLEQICQIKMEKQLFKRKLINFTKQNLMKTGRVVEVVVVS